MRDYRLYMQDILEAMQAIEAFVENIEFEDFQNDDKTLSAVIRKFEIIGEATKGIPEDIRAKYPHIPWKEMAGMRDKLIHFYFGVNAKRVWHAIKRSIPHYQPEIQSILKEWKG